MAYHINVVQAVSVSGVTNGTLYNNKGGWTRLTNPSLYRDIQWYAGDPDQVPGNFPGKSSGEYRMIEYWVNGNLSKNEFPTYNGVPFSSITVLPAASVRNQTDATISWGFRGTFAASDSYMQTIYDAFNAGGQQGWFIFSSAQAGSWGPIWGSTDGSNFSQYGGVSGEAWVEMDPAVYGAGARMAVTGYPNTNISRATLDWVVI